MKGGDAQSYIENEGDILPVFEVFYLESIKYAAGRAVAAFDRFDIALAEGKHKDLVVANVQEALTHIGELSRMFWPSPMKKGKEEKEVACLRGKKLRVAFNLDGTSPLKNRCLRDALEHFDDRLDAYLKEFPVGQIITDPMVGSVEQNVEPVRIFRMVDPSTSTFVILGKEYEFGPLREVARSVQLSAERMLQNGGRLE